MKNYPAGTPCKRCGARAVINLSGEPLCRNCWRNEVLKEHERLESIDYEKVDKLIKHLSKKEEEIHQTNQDLIKKIKDIKNPVEHVDFMLKEVLPLTIKGNLIMDKLNLLAFLQYSNMPDFNEKFSTLLMATNENFKILKIQFESIRAQIKILLNMGDKGEIKE